MSGSRHTCPSAIHPILETSSLHSGNSGYHPPGPTMTPKELSLNPLPGSGDVDAGLCAWEKEACVNWSFLLVPIPASGRTPTDPVQGVPRPGPSQKSSSPAAGLPHPKQLSQEEYQAALPGAHYRAESPSTKGLCLASAHCISPTVSLVIPRDHSFSKKQQKAGKT